MVGEAEGESARAGRRGLGASEARRARSARAPDGPPDMGRPSARALELADGVWGHRKRAGREAPEHRTGPQIWGGRARERSSWPTGSGGIGSAQGAKRPSTGRAPRYGEAERESARAGRRGLGASEARRARSARAPDGPPDMGRPSARALELADGVWGHRKRAGREAPEHRTGPQIWGGRARERSSWPTGSGGIGSAQGAKRPSTGRAPRYGEAERESARAGRRGLGASEARRARSARALDGPPDMGRPSARALELADGVWGHRKRAGREAPEHWTGPQIWGGRARERSSWPTGSGGIGSAQGAKRPSTGRAPRYGEAERESARAGRRGLGASEARRARSARALDGPPDMGRPSARALEL